MLSCEIVSFRFTSDSQAQSFYKPARPWSDSYPPGSVVGAFRPGRMETEGRIPVSLLPFFSNLFLPFFQQIKRDAAFGRGDGMMHGLARQTYIPGGLWYMGNRHSWKEQASARDT